MWLKDHCTEILLQENTKQITVQLIQLNIVNEFEHTPLFTEFMTRFNPTDYLPEKNKTCY